jgi:hypothetical protein
MVQHTNCSCLHLGSAVPGSAEPGDDLSSPYRNVLRNVLFSVAAQLEMEATLGPTCCQQPQVLGLSLLLLGALNLLPALLLCGPQGFPAKLRTAEVSELESDEAEAKREADARRSLINLAMAWSLVLLCCSHHFGHMLHMMGYHQFAHTPFMNFMSNPTVSGALGAFALFGPGRTLLVDGAKSLLNNTPNMNSLVALGSVTR